MAVNKVEVNTENGVKTLMDLTEDTVTVETLTEGETAHGADGALIVGEAKKINIVQETGTSTTDIMSQAAATAEFNALYELAKTFSTKDYVSTQAAVTLQSANAYTDEKIAFLMNNSTEAADSIMELVSVMNENSDAISALTEIAGSKAPLTHGHAISDVSGLQTSLNGKASSVHYHDDRYYTETEINNLLAGYSKTHSHPYLSTSGGTLGGDLTLKHGGEPTLAFQAANSSSNTMEIKGITGSRMLMGGGTYGYIQFNGAGGYFAPFIEGNYSLGGSGMRFHTAWLMNAPNVSSLAEMKTGITQFTSALEEVDKTDIFQYKYKHNIERNGDDIIHTGFVIGEGYNCSEYLLGEGGEGIDMYNGIGLAFGAVKELYELVKEQQRKIASLESRVS